MATHSSLLAWRIPAQRGLAGYSPWGHTESDTTERLSTHLPLQTQLAIAGLFYFPKQFYLKLYQPDLNTNDNATKWPLTDIRCTRGQSYMKIMCVLVAQLCLTFVTPSTVARQAPLSVGFSRQEYQSGLPCPSPGDLPDPGIEPRFPALLANSLPSEPPRKL